MREIIELYTYIRDNYNRNYSDIICKDNEILIVFHKEFKMKVSLCGLYKVYFNDIFYYDIDSQDVVDTINDFFTNSYIFCEVKKRKKSIIKIVPVDSYTDSYEIINAWSTLKTLKNSKEVTN